MVNINRLKKIKVMINCKSTTKEFIPKNFNRFIIEAFLTKLFNEAYCQLIIIIRAHILLYHIIINNK